MRKMAYTVTVSNVTPIEGKDKIQIINFKENGYNVIASKEITNNNLNHINHG